MEIVDYRDDDPRYVYEYWGLDSTGNNLYKKTINEKYFTHIEERQKTINQDDKGKVVLTETNKFKEYKKQQSVPQELPTYDRTKYDELVPITENILNEKLITIIDFRQDISGVTHQYLPEFAKKQFYVPREFIVYKLPKQEEIDVLEESQPIPLYEKPVIKETNFSRTLSEEIKNAPYPFAGKFFKPENDYVLTVNQRTKLIRIVNKTENKTKEFTYEYTIKRRPERYRNVIVYSEIMPDDSAERIVTIDLDTNQVVVRFKKYEEDYGATAKYQFFTEEFTTEGSFTYTVSANTVEITAEAYGAGGNSGNGGYYSGSSFYGGPGGGGAYIKSVFNLDQLRGVTEIRGQVGQGAGTSNFNQILDSQGGYLDTRNNSFFNTTAKDSFVVVGSLTGIAAGGRDGSTTVSSGQAGYQGLPKGYYNVGYSGMGSIPEFYMTSSYFGIDPLFDYYNANGTGNELDYSAGDYFDQRSFGGWAGSPDGIGKKSLNQGAAGGTAAVPGTDTAPTSGTAPGGGGASGYGSDVGFPNAHYGADGARGFVKLTIKKRSRLL